MKIVFDARVHLNYYSGISRYIICLLEAYASEFPMDELIVLLNPTISKDNSIYTTLSGFSSVQFKEINAGHMGPKNYLLMGKIIRKLAPDIYHYPHLDAPIFTGGVPVIATIHDANSNKNVKKFDDRFGLKSFYFKHALKTTLKRAKKVIFVSDSIKKEILTDFNLKDDTERYIRIHNGFELSFNQVDPTKTAEVLSKLNCSDKSYILFVGQIREHKNIFRVVEAFKRFNQKFPSYQLIIVGHNYLNLKLADKNIVHFEKVNNTTLKALYSGCAAFLFPSLFEGFGFPILEAFSFGKPVITSDYGATKEIGGNLGILVNPKDVNDIANGIEKAIHNNSGILERIQYTEKFAWKNKVVNLRQVYLDALTKK